MPARPGRRFPLNHECELDPDRLVFVDGTWITANMAPLQGRLLPGVPYALNHRPRVDPGARAVRRNGHEQAATDVKSPGHRIAFSRELARQRRAGCMMRNHLLRDQGLPSREVNRRIPVACPDHHRLSRIAFRRLRPPAWNQDHPAGLSEVNDGRPSSAV